MDKKYNPALDVLRIFSVIGTVLAPISLRYSFLYEVDTFEYLFSVVLYSFCQLSLPLFVMISGALMLSDDREIDYKRLWLHNILRIVIVFIIWNFCYYAYTSLFDPQVDFLRGSTMYTISNIVQGGDHLWYLGIFVGLYAFLPIIKTWLLKASKQDIEYFLFVFIIFQLFRDTFEKLLNNSIIDRISDFLTIAEMSGYVGYFVFGYYLLKYEVPKRMRTLLYIAIPFDFAFNALFSVRESKRLGHLSTSIGSAFGIFTFLCSVAIFLFFTRHQKKNVRTKTLKILHNISLDTLGVFLLSEMAVEFTFSRGLFQVLTFPYVYALPMTIAIILVGLVLVAILRRIPFVGRYIC